MFISVGDMLTVGFYEENTTFHLVQPIFTTCPTPNMGLQILFTFDTCKHKNRNCNFQIQVN